MNNGDGKFVVVQGDERVSGLKDSQQEAQQEADKLNKKLSESKGEGTAPAPQAPPATVKQNLYG